MLLCSSLENLSMLIFLYMYNYNRGFDFVMLVENVTIACVYKENDINLVEINGLFTVVYCTIFTVIINCE